MYFLSDLGLNDTVANLVFPSFYLESLEVTHKVPLNVQVYWRKLDILE